jgi:hypothetical protein
VRTRDVQKKNRKKKIERASLKKEEIEMSDKWLALVCRLTDTMCSTSKTFFAPHSEREV